VKNSYPKAFIFGAGASGKDLLPTIRKQYQIIGFLDNEKSKWGKSLEGLPVSDPKSVLEADYDADVIGTYVGLEIITAQLLDMGVKRGQIDDSYVSQSVKSRIVFLEKLGEVFDENGTQGCVAEGGVFQGDFAEEINRVFPRSRLYLFDTFSGFDERDVALEQKHKYSELGAGHFNSTSEEVVMSKLPYPDMCVIRKGYFPETAMDVDEVFCFVNLDFDLYKPILAGLEFFYPRMVSGGVILVHEYFSDSYKGVKQAVKDFAESKGGIRLFPIGDGMSIGVLC